MITSSIRKVAEVKGSKKMSKSQFEKCLKQLYVEYIHNKKEKPHSKKIVGGDDFPIPVSEMFNTSSLKFAPFEHAKVQHISNVPFSNFQ